MNNRNIDSINTMLIIQEFKLKEQNETGLRSKALPLIALGCFWKLLSAQTDNRLGRWRVQSRLQELNVTLNELPFLLAKNGCFLQKPQTDPILSPRQREARSSGSAVLQCYVFQVTGCSCEHGSATTVLQWFLFFGFASWLTHSKCS